MAQELKILDLQQFDVQAVLRARQDHQPSRRLSEALSLLYRDIIGLCHQLYCMFSTKRKVWRKAKLYVGMAWKPFDQKFAECLEAFRHHKKLLKLELDAASSAITFDTYGNIEKGIAVTNQQSNILVEDMIRMVMLDLNAQQKNNTCTGTKTHGVKAWINPPQWLPVFETSVSNRTPGTGLWMLDHPSYTTWRDSALDGSVCGELLFIQAKPGYGKTTLCATLIEDLCSLQASEFGRYVYFYFFEKQSLHANSDSAFRAILTQILHSNRCDQEALDLALLMKENGRGGQLIASQAEVRDLLAVILPRFPGATLVFDGIDECSNGFEFLQLLNSMSHGHECKILLSGRPTVSVTCFTNSMMNTIRLEEFANLTDIESYLQPHIEEMIKNDKLEEREPAELIVQDIARRSHSMFLWATLMIKYLNIEFISPEERHHAISNMNLFEDLDLMYFKIFQQIRKLATDKRSWANVQSLFEWVAFAARPLSATELRLALAIEVGKPTKASRFLAKNLDKFQETVSKMSGSLVEFHQDRTARFIHLSVLEFLIDALGSEHTGADRLYISPEPTHCIMAIKCLSYLILDIPNGPLCDTSKNPRNKRDIMSSFPFLLYSTQFWTLHGYHGLVIDQRQKTNSARQRTGFLTWATMFFLDKESVTAWIEASWTFDNPPSLGCLDEHASIAFELNGSRWSDLLLSFSNDLTQLNKRWAHLLQEDPTEIWKPSILTFNPSRFWAETRAGNLASLSSDPLEGSLNPAVCRKDAILVSSTCSSDGTEVAMIKVWPSKLFNELMHDASFQVQEQLQRINILAANWQVNYTVRRVSEDVEVCNITFQLPDLPVAMLLRRAFSSKTPRQFPFPASFSNNLRQVSILNHVVRTRASKEPLMQPSVEFAAQELKMMSGQRLWSQYQSPTDIHSSLECLQCLEQIPGLVTLDYWYQITFSPDSRYLVMLCGENKPGTKTSFYSDWCLAVYEDHSLWDSAPDFQMINYITTNVSSFAINKPIVFHHYEPILAISRLATLSLWFFNEIPPRMMEMLGQPLDNLAWSACGNFLHGTALENRNYGAPIIINVSTELSNRKKSAEDTSSPVKPSHQSNQQLMKTNALSLLQNGTTLGSTALPKTINSSAIVFGSRHGRSQIAMLRQYHEERAVVLQSMNEDGIVQEQRLINLPDSSTLEQSYSTLAMSSCDQESIKLVLNKASQDTYSCQDVPDLQLPAAVTRSVSSIPSTTKRLALRLDNTEETRKRQRRTISH
ncbi:MAG: hypothetical protein M1821_002561 [Bathelium mastoideum]|nr:MAG: hypothetical protein M1821_002561 [Bathelium mastoideum]